MNKKKRDTVTYDLVRGRGNRVVYRGITSQSLKVRAMQHSSDGKKFDRIVQTSRRMTGEGASSQETENLERYRRSHGGRNPFYNETDDG